jgi:hypothetical protein
MLLPIHLRVFCGPKIEILGMFFSRNTAPTMQHLDQGDNSCNKKAVQVKFFGGGDGPKMAGKKL